MLICDINTLETVYTLYLAKEIILYGTDSLDLEKIVRINRSFGKLVSCLKVLSVYNLDP